MSDDVRDTVVIVIMSFAIAACFQGGWVFV